MFENLLFRFQDQNYNPSRAIRWLTRALLVLPVIRSSNSKFSIAMRLIATSCPPFGASPEKNEAHSPIEILFVSTLKDLDVLPFSIDFALKAVAHHSEANVVVVVPPADFPEVLKLLDRKLKVRVIKETDLVSHEYISLLRNKFGWRAGWVLQQLLKVTWVCNSSSQAVLVIDSDTLLLSPRAWISKTGKQILTPTWEYHIPYFDFLNKFANFPKRPKSSFVPHHMLMQPKIFREALSRSLFHNLDGLMSELLGQDFGSEVSPFCIEYEFYAQYLIMNHKELVELRRWSNFGVSRPVALTPSEIQVLKDKFEGKFASISLHSYLK